MRALITGGAGFLGSHLGDLLLARGHAVTALDTAGDLKIRHNLGRRGFRYVRGSVLAPRTVGPLVAGCDVVFHMAAVVGVERYVKDPRTVLDVNINGTREVLRAALRHGRKVVFASTSEVYGRNPAVPFREDADRVLGATTVDRWCYATSKAAAEHFCLAYAGRGLPVAIVRYFNAYGPRLDRVAAGRILTIFLGQLRRGEDLTVVGDGRQTRCFMYVDDAVRATAAAGTRRAAVGGIFNVGTTVETPIRDLAKRMIAEYAALTGRPACGIRYVRPEEVYGPSYEDIRRRAPDAGRMRRILRVTPRVGLRDGLRRTIAWFLENGGAAPRRRPGPEVRRRNG